MTRHAGLLPEQWYCPCCGDLHDTEAQARLCCACEPSPGYGCPVCQLPHATEVEALQCCAWESTPEGARTIRQALEEAGQLALHI